MGINVTTGNFHREVMESSEKIMLDFWAEWCPPCRKFSPLIDEFAKSHHSIKVCRINVDEEPELTAAFHISIVPTVALVEKGKIIGMSEGVCTSEELEKLSGRN